jgi:hypothetical protein
LSLAGPHLSLRPGMGIAKRLSITVLALAFVFASATQMMLSALAIASMPVPLSIGAEAMAAHPDGRPVAPCERSTPVCVEHVGCVIAVSLAASATAAGVPVERCAVSYNTPELHLAGRSVEPELFPPIGAA